MAHPTCLRNRAIEMRRVGASYTDISVELGLCKSTVRNMVKGVCLTVEQRALLDARLPSTAGQTIDPEILRKGGKKGGHLAWTVHREKSISAARRNIEVASLTYTSAEMIVKVQLEALFGRSFRKERIGKRVVDFACDDLIIEHSVDWGKGIGDMIDRYRSIISDRRRKIAYVDTEGLGPRRRARLEAVVNEVRDYRALAK